MSPRVSASFQLVRKLGAVLGAWSILSLSCVSAADKHAPDSDPLKQGLPEATASPSEVVVEVGLLESDGRAERKEPKPTTEEPPPTDAVPHLPKGGLGGEELLAGDEPSDQKPKPKAATAESTGGHVEPSAIRDAVAGQQGLFSRCLRADASIEVEVTVSPGGRVVDAKSARSVPDDPKLRDCLVAAFKQLTIKPYEGAAAAKVRVAVALKRR